MRPKRHATRIAAQKAGERAGLPADARMVRQCAGCPSSLPSRKRRQSAAALSRALAGVLGADAPLMRRAVDAAQRSAAFEAGRFARVVSHMLTAAGPATLCGLRLGGLRADRATADRERVTCRPCRAALPADD